MSAATTSTEIFPVPNVPAIEFHAVTRPRPTDAEEALAQLEALRDLYDWQNIPPALNQNLTIQSVAEYARAWKLINDQLPYDIQWLKELDGRSVPGADNIQVQKIDNTKKSQLDWLENRLPNQLADSAKYTRQFISGCIDPIMWQHISKAADCDMSDSSQVRNVLGRPELNETRAQQIRQVAEGFEAAILFDNLLGIESDWSQKKNAFREMVLRYQEKLAAAAEAIQPPEDIGDSELRKIAQQVMTDKQYRFPKPVRIIVNAPKRSSGKDHYTIDFGERSIEKSAYRWDEFQVATIEKEGDQYFLYYNTLLNYEVGPHTVPTGKWVLGPRHKSAPISAVHAKE